MISLEEAKQALNIPNLTDEEILKLRDDLYRLIATILDEKYENGEIPKNGLFKK